MAEKSRIVIRVVVPFVVSALILYLLFLKIDATSVLTTLKTCRLDLLALAVAISVSINILLGAVKWRYILSVLGCDLSCSQALSIRSGCIPFKIIFPMKSSELLKALYLSRVNRFPFMRGVGSLMIDKVLNLLVLVCIAICGLLYMDIGMLALIFIGALVVILFLLFSARFRNFLVSIVGRIHPRIHRIFHKILDGFDAIDGKSMFILIGYSIIYQLSEFVNTYILLKAVGINVPFWYLLVVVPVIMIISNLPVTVLGMGTREAAIVFFLSQWGTSATLLGGSILVTLVEHILPVLVGVLFIHYCMRYFTMRADLLSLKVEDV